MNDAAMFASVGRALARRGDLSIKSVVGDTGVSIGSIYNRYGSREGLMALTWLDAVEAFQDQFLEALQSDVPDAGEAAALTVPQFSRQMRDRAIILATCRRSEFLSDKTPDDLRQRVETANDQTFKAITDFAKLRGKSPDIVRMSMIAVPLGAVRLYLPERKVPHSVDQHIRRAYRAIMDEG